MIAAKTDVPKIAALPVSDLVWDTILTLPCSTHLTEAEQQTVIAAVRSCFEC